MKRSGAKLSRRDFVSRSATGVAAGAALYAASAEAAQPANPAAHQATGVKVGEVTDTSALIWTRLTAQPAANATGMLLGAGAQLPANTTVNQLRGACPGMA